MSAERFDAGEIGARYGLTCIEDLSQRGSTAAAVLHVRDAAGAEYLLKRLVPVFGEWEIAALRAWEGFAVTPRVIAELEPGIHLLEWVEGRSLADVPAEEPVAGVDIGRALARLHCAVLPSGIPDVRDRIVLDGWERLPPVLLALAGRLAAMLRAHEPDRAALLHADLVPANVILSPVGPAFIDPLGRRGLPAWDLAQLAAAAAGRGRTDLLGPLIEGYGACPPLLAETFAWLVLFYLQKNLKAPDSPFTANLLPLAAALKEAGDVQEFLSRHLNARWRRLRDIFPM